MLESANKVIEKAREFINQGQLNHAERELLTAIKARKDTKEIYFLLGDVYLRKNSLIEAEKAFKTVVTIDSHDYLAYLNLGNICLLNGDLEGAEGCFSLILESSAEYRDVAVPLLGDFYFEQEKYFEAFHYFEAALKINPEDEDFLLKAGICLKQKGMITPARELLKKVIQINPWNEKAASLLAPLEDKQDSTNDKATIEDNFIRNFKLLKQYYSDTTSPDENHLNETFTENYRKNLSILKSHYPHIYENLKNTPDKLDLQIIPIIDGLFDLLIQKNGHRVWMYGYFHPLERCNTISNEYKKKLSKDTPICLIGMAAGYEFKSLFQLSSDPLAMLGKKTPINIVEPSIDIFKANLMIHDLTNILASNRVFFFLGNECFEDFLQHLTMYQIPLFAQGVILLDETIEDKSEIYIQKINDIRNRENSELKSQTNQLNAYYDQMTYQNWQKVYSPEGKRPLRVLGITSRFTTFLQYCIRDVLDGFKELGCETMELKETRDANRITPFQYTKALKTFKPDLIFLIDHNRTACPIIPENIPLVSWVQDQLETQFNTEEAKKIGEKDFILAVGKDFYEQLVKCGYPEEKILIQPVITNTKIYKPIKLQKTDIEKYGCDVSFVHHGGKSPEQEFASLLEKSTLIPLAKKLLETMYKIVSERFLSGDYCYWNEYEELLNKSEELIGLKLIDNKARESILYQFKLIIGNRFIRQIPLEIIADMGVDLKLYGKDWENHPRLSRYACGIAENGEELNKIFNASKIIMHLQPEATTNPRVFDGMASSGFLLIQFLKYDVESVADYFEEDREFVFFRNQEELKEKIAYFLNHPEERERISQNGYKKIKEKYTYKVRMKHLLEIIARNPNSITSEL